MAEFTADFRDVQFALVEQTGIEKLFSLPAYKELDVDTVNAILEEGYKFARNQMAPMNAVGDEQGATFDKATGEVKVPASFHETYKLYCDNGWLSFAHNPEWGGQGMPSSLHLAVSDFFFGACLSFSLKALLTTGAAHLIETFGSDEQKKTYLEAMYSGRWAGTMCLTESGAGSDVGAARTRAKKEGDHYLIEGEKIFITYGDDDLAENIIHAVLARTEGAPEGTKGLSLFIVPKIRVNPDGSLGEPNDVKCTGIEHKLGIHASPTCTLSYGENGKCWGWLLGEENKGMREMFQMMNEARITVGLQGTALANAAYQLALAYARERVQGKSLTNGEPVPIIEHPDVRQMLMWQKAISEGTRALLLRTAFYRDLAEHTEDDAERERFGGLVDLLTPVCKAYASDQGFRSIEMSLQTLGGYGYLKEYGIEQHLRDTKIASIYEGTNGIQALDLVGRKLPARGGADFKALVGMLAEISAKHAKHPVLGGEMKLLDEARDALVDATMHFATSKQPIHTVMNATAYLDLLGQVVLGWLLLEAASLAYPRLASLAETKGVSVDDAQALAKLCADDEEARFLQGKVKVAQFYARRALPLCRGKADVLKAGDLSAMEVVL